MLSRRNRGHVALDAISKVSLGHRRMLQVTVARYALAAIETGIISPKGLVRTVARETGKRTLTLTEARALREINRLMAEVPRISPISSNLSSHRHAVAASTEFVQCCAVEAAWILNRLAARRGIGSLHRLHMRAPGTMARLAPYSQLCGNQIRSGPKLQRSRRVALETSHDLSLRRKRLVHHARRLRPRRWHGGPVPRGEVQFARTRIQAEPMLDISFIFQLTDEGYRLVTRSKSPVNRNGTVDLARDDVRAQPSRVVQDFVSITRIVHGGAGLVQSGNRLLRGNTAERMRVLTRRLFLESC